MCTAMMWQRTGRLCHGRLLDKLILPAEQGSDACIRSTACLQFTSTFLARPGNSRLVTANCRQWLVAVVSKHLGCAARSAVEEWRAPLLANLIPMCQPSPCTQVSHGIRVALTSSFEDSVRQNVIVRHAGSAYLADGRQS